MKTLSFLICVLMLLPAFNCLAALADESSADTSSGAPPMIGRMSGKT